MPTTDRVFVEAAINPVVLTPVCWQCGQSAILGGQTWIIKAGGGDSLGLHSDSHGIPPGAGQIAHMCNASWVCTDYDSAEDGPTVFIPGSHKYGRATPPHESKVETTAFKTFPLIAKAGSLAIWNGATWHGSLPRTKSRLRVTLVQNYFRPYMRTMRNYDGAVSPQLLQKYPDYLVESRIQCRVEFGLNHVGSPPRCCDLRRDVCQLRHIPPLFIDGR